MHLKDGFSVFCQILSFRFDENDDGASTESYSGVYRCVVCLILSFVGINCGCILFFAFDDCVGAALHSAGFSWNFNQ